MLVHKEKCPDCGAPIMIDKRGDSVHIVCAGCHAHAVGKTYKEANQIWNYWKKELANERK